MLASLNPLGWNRAKTSGARLGGRGDGENAKAAVVWHVPNFSPKPRRGPGRGERKNSGLWGLLSTDQTPDHWPLGFQATRCAGITGRGADLAKDTDRSTQTCLKESTRHKLGALLSFISFRLLFGGGGALFSPSPFAPEQPITSKVVFANNQTDSQTAFGPVNLLGVTAVHSGTLHSERATEQTLRCMWSVNTKVEKTAGTIFTGR